MDKSNGPLTYYAYRSFMASYSKSIGISMEFIPVWSLSNFATLTSSALLERLSARFWSVSVGIFPHSTRRKLIRSDNGVGREVLLVISVLLKVFSGTCSWKPMPWSSRCTVVVLMLMQNDRRSDTRMTNHSVQGYFCLTLLVKFIV